MVDPTGYAPVSPQCQCGILLMDEGSYVSGLPDRTRTCIKSVGRNHGDFQLSSQGGFSFVRSFSMAIRTNQITFGYFQSSLDITTTFHQTRNIVYFLTGVVKIHHIIWIFFTTIFTGIGGFVFLHPFFKLGTGNTRNSILISLLISLIVVFTIRSLAYFAI